MWIFQNYTKGLLRLFLRSAVLFLFGISFDLAIVIAILDHAIKNLFTLAIGVPATAGIGVDVSELHKRRRVN